jgi:hypothetical protein
MVRVQRAVNAASHAVRERYFSAGPHYRWTEEIT